MAGIAAFDITNHHQASFKQAVTDDAPLSIVSPGVYELEGRPGEHAASIFKIETSIPKNFLTLGRIVRYFHDDLL